MKQRQMLKTGCYQDMDASQTQLFNLRENESSPEDEVPLQRLRYYEQKQFIEAQIQDGDTLQALSLKFRCPVSELKRINHMDKDNEIHARRTLKVPITPFSVLTEAFAEQRNSAPVFHTNFSAEIAAPVDSIVNSIVSTSTTVNVNSTILNSVLSPNRKTSAADNGENDRVDDISSPLLKCQNGAVTPASVEAVVIEEFTNRGADFGLKWIHLLICIVALGFVVPLIYVFYVAEHHHHHAEEHH